MLYIPVSFVLRRNAAARATAETSKRPSISATGHLLRFELSTSGIMTMSDLMIY